MTGVQTCALPISEYLKAHWPKMNDFRELMKAYDPKGKLVNDWVTQLFA